MNTTYHDRLEESDTDTTASAVVPVADPLDAVGELTHETTTPVTISPETAAAITARLGDSVASAGGEPVLWRHARDMAYEYVTVQPQIRVAEFDISLATFITDIAEVPITDCHDTTPAMLAGPSAFDGIVSAYSQLEQVPLGAVDHTIQSRILNALEELDNAITTAAKNGQLQPANE